MLPLLGDDDDGGEVFCPLAGGPDSSWQEKLPSALARQPNFMSSIVLVLELMPETKMPMLWVSPCDTSPIIS